MMSCRNTVVYTLWLGSDYRKNLRDYLHLQVRDHPNHGLVDEEVWIPLWGAIDQGFNDQHWMSQ